MDWVIIVAVVLVLVFGVWDRYQLMRMAKATGCRVCNIEAKLDKIIKILPRYDEIADLESMTIPEIEGLEDKDE